MTICFRSCGTVWTNTIRFPVWKITTRSSRPLPSSPTNTARSTGWNAALRTEFNITTGPKLDEMDKIKFKSCMKEYYAKAGIPTARYHLVEGLEDALEFAHTVGYPVVVKPDNGVGACNTYKLQSDEDVRWFISNKDDAVYIMEEFVNGYVQTFDGIVDS